MVVNRKYLGVLSIESSQYQYNTLIESLEDENSFNDTKVDVPTKIKKNSTNLLLSNLKQEKPIILAANGKEEYIVIPEMQEAVIAQNDSNGFPFAEKSTVSPIDTSSVAVELGSTAATNEEASIYEDIGAIAVANMTFSNSTQKFGGISKNENKLISFPSHLVSYNTHHNKKQQQQQHNRKNSHNGKIIRKHNRKKSHHQQLHSYEKNGPRNENKANKVFDYGPTGTTYLKFSTTTSAAIRDSDIHIVKPEKLPEIVPSTPVSSNSKIIEIKQKTKRAIFSKEKTEPQMLLNESSEYVAEMDSIEESYTTSTIESGLSDYNVAHLDGFAGILQLVFGVKKPINVKIFNNPPSAEFLNLLFALLVWCVRYPAVFWTTAKSFATVFSVQMIASAADIIFSYVGISSLFKLQIYSQGQPIQNQGLVLNASVTLALFLLSVVLILSSSMVLYLFGYGRLSAKMRDRSIITLSSKKSWIYFAHCSSLCYILALTVVKAPLLNDLSATYRNSLHCPMFMAALVSVMHISLWIIIWMVLTVKSKWSFKLPPLDAYAVIGKATTKPLLVHNRRSLTNTTAGILSNSTNVGSSNSTASVNTETKLKYGNTSQFLTNTSSSNVLNDAPDEEIYWPNTTPSSPKLKVTFNEVTSTSEDCQRHRLLEEQQQRNDKRNSLNQQAPAYFTSIEGEIDDGEYATLRSDPTTIHGNISGISCETKNNKTGFNKNCIPTDTVNSVHLSEYNEIPPPPPNMTSSMNITNHTTTACVNPRSTYVNFLDDCSAKVLGDDNISEEGKLFERVLDDSVTYASTKDLEPPLPSPPTSVKTKEARDNNTPFMLTEKCVNIAERNQLPSSPECLISPLAPVKVALRTSEAHIFHNATNRCLRSAGSEVTHEVLTPKSDTNSFGTACTISPPERAPSESSSGIHSAEERELEVIIRPRVAHKNASKLPPAAIQEEPNNRCTNMRMSSFAGGNNLNSATLPSQRSNADEKFNYYQHCSTMPLATVSHKQNDQQLKTAVYATSAQCMSKTQNTFSNVSSFKTPPLYVNSGFAISGHKQRPYDQNVYIGTIVPPQPQLTHTILSNGVRYSNPNILRRHPFLKVADPQNSLANSTIPEDRDSANYSMISDQENIYATSNSFG